MCGSNHLISRAGWNRCEDILSLFLSDAWQAFTHLWTVIDLWEPPSNPDSAQAGWDKCQQ